MWGGVASPQIPTSISNHDETKIVIQLEQEKLNLETKLKNSEDTAFKLQLENSTLTERVKELDDSKSLVMSLEEKIARLEEDSVKMNVSDARFVIYMFAVMGNGQRNNKLYLENSCKLIFSSSEDISLSETTLQTSQEIELLTPGYFSIAQYKAAIENLNVQMGDKTVELGKVRSKLSETEQTLSNRDKEV